MMADTYWFKQNDKPLYDDLQWSKPENKRYAGKLLIIGGESNSFSIPAESFGYAEAAGIGTARIVLPDHVRQLVPEPFKMMADYAPSLRHGSFAKAALGELVEHAKWADTVLLSGGFARNSETMALLERFSSVYRGRLVFSSDAIHAFQTSPLALLDRPESLVVATIGDLQKLTAAKKILLTHEQHMTKMVESMHELSKCSPVIYITCLNDTLVVAYDGKVSTTPAKDHLWRTKAAAHAAVWWTQFPDKPFEAITTALLE